jgi:hypothetical protein
MDTSEEYIIKQAINDLDTNSEKFRNKAFNILLPISENNPELLYSEWHRILSILNKKEVSNKYVAIPLLANMISVDKDNKFEKIFDEFYELLNHESPVVSPHIAGQSGKILKAKPYLQEKILEKLLSTDEKSQCRYKELLKSYVIDALDNCYNEIENKDKIIRFVEKQIYSESPKTKKRAREFLKKYKKEKR